MPITHIKKGSSAFTKPPLGQCIKKVSSNPGTIIDALSKIGGIFVIVKSVMTLILKYFHEKIFEGKPSITINNFLSKRKQMN